MQQDEWDTGVLLEVFCHLLFICLYCTLSVLSLPYSHLLLIKKHILLDFLTLQNLPHKFFTVSSLKDIF